MARTKPAKSDTTEPEAQAIMASLRRIENLLALLLVKDKSETESVRLLTDIGYSPAEITKLFGKGPNWANVILYRSRKGSSK